MKWNMKNTSLKNQVENKFIHGAFSIKGFEQLRSQSMNNLKHIELPDIKNEDWKYTNLQSFLEAINPDGNEVSFEIKDIYQPNTLLIHNGRLIHSTISDEIKKWINIIPIHQFSEFTSGKSFETISEKSSDYFVLLNNVSFNRGWILHIKSDAPDNISLRFEYIWSNTSDIIISSRNIVYMEANTRLHITENHRSEEQSCKIFVNHVTECFLNNQSELIFNRLQEMNSKVCALSYTFSSIATGARFEMNNVIAGQGIIRNNYIMNLHGEEAYTGITGLNLLTGQQHTDSWVQVNHFSQNCNSDQLFKSIVNDLATAAFTGKIYVARGAQKTNAYQSCRSIVLSDEAKSYARPQLEIYADDVKCSHGATTGQINEEAIFYMQSRGISKPTAQRLLLSAFASDVINKIHDDAFCEQVEALIDSKFSIQ
ncbi:MAG: Fe-S cluster assembly protein SufD [Flavobacteriales bacterium]|nr:Fe-S cluster assembly protein SufD [Flavobacteriales bacterium]